MYIKRPVSPYLGENLKSTKHVKCTVTSKKSKKKVLPYLGEK